MTFGVYSVLYTIEREQCLNYIPTILEVSIVLQISTHPNLGLNLMHSAVRLSQLFTANIFVKGKNKPKNTSRNLT